MIQRSISNYNGMNMKQMVKSHLGPMSTGSSSTPDPSTLSPRESHRNWNIESYLVGKSFMGNIFPRFVLPKDTAKSHEHRELEFRRQIAMPWNNNFMHTPTDNQRLNNPAQTSFVKQRQLNVGSSYGQFYAFMHAMSAAFGNLNGSH